MTLIKLNKRYDILCLSESTRYGFRHKAILMINGHDYDIAKCCYYNRTWESFQYETVINSLMTKTKELTDTEKKKFISKIYKKLR